MRRTTERRSGAGGRDAPRAVRGEQIEILAGRFHASVRAGRRVEAGAPRAEARFARLGRIERRVGKKEQDGNIEDFFVSCIAPYPIEVSGNICNPT